MMQGSLEEAPKQKASSPRLELQYVSYKLLNGICNCIIQCSLILHL